MSSVVLKMMVYYQSSSVPTTSPWQYQQLSNHTEAVAKSRLKRPNFQTQDHFGGLPPVQAPQKNLALVLLRPDLSGSSLSFQLSLFVQCNQIYWLFPMCWKTWLKLRTKWLLPLRCSSSVEWKDMQAYQINAVRCCKCGDGHLRRWQWGWRRGSGWFSPVPTWHPTHSYLLDE